MLQSHFASYLQQFTEAHQIIFTANFLQGFNRLFRRVNNPFHEYRIGCVQSNHKKLTNHTFAEIKVLLT